MKLLDGFFKCAFCLAVAPKGNHVCGDKYTQDAKQRWFATNEQERDRRASTVLAEVKR
ncbi:hypothetical protein UFOVP154_57 [uncultured Caudovirales phage]|uniref:Uncharacterized protein n=1 Tax=uncultured Caudovirales phage TaxID=2100421 RepID=A0A6J7WFW1_9CAUD|nr:hypothetical protein UFOVP8_42 [uncultured Caudovirales phage]CAB5170922.1 hypothetical protein UFOVP154_57 [uncultured Caudovirales phage]